MDFILNIFWNKQDSRLRTGFRIFLLLLTLTIVSFPSRFIMPRPENISDATLEYTLFRAFYGLIATLLSIWIIASFIDKRRMSGLGLQLNKAWWTDLSFGLILGIFLMSSIFLIEYSLGWITISQNVFTMDIAGFSYTAIAIFFIRFIAVGINEELIVRGYLLKNLAEGLNFKSFGSKKAIYISWIVTSILFGVGHLGNPNATLIAGLNIAAAGIFLGAGFVLTGRLALPIGVHITWNFFQGNIFGFPVSGINTIENSQMITIVQGGPDVWTGGTFGPEAGLIGICAIILGTILTIWWVKIREGQAILDLTLAESPTATFKVIYDKNDIIDKE